VEDFEGRVGGAQELANGTDDEESRHGAAGSGTRQKEARATDTELKVLLVLLIQRRKNVIVEIRAGTAATRRHYLAANALGCTAVMRKKQLAL